MRNGFLLFLSTILGVYTLANIYLLWRTCVMLHGSGLWRWVAMGVIFLFAIAYPLGRYFDHHGVAPWNTIGIWVGSFWIAAILYLFFLFLGIRLFDGIAWFAGHAGDWTDTWFKLRPLVWSVTMAFVAVLLAYGHWNALHPRLVKMEWALPKLPSGFAPFKVVAISDLHTGTIIGRKRVEKIVAAINAEKPDLVLLVGDTIDSDLTPVVQQDTGAALQQLQATHGVYAVTGNHEYIGGAQPSVDYLEAHGVRVLRNQIVFIGDAFYLVGREDASVRRYSGTGRPPLSALLEPLDRSRPVIVMDHQPVALDEAEQAGVDGQLSGHTHDGQFWPICYITRSIFRLSYGYKKFGPLNAYVSCGVGTWGPPVRIGNQPEIVVITLVRPPG